MANVNNSEFVILEGTGSVKGLVTPSIPSNLPQLGGLLGVINGIPYFVGDKILLKLVGVEGEQVTNEILKGFLNKLTFRTADKEAGVHSNIQVVALEKSDGNIDFGIHVHNTFQTTYAQAIGGFNPHRSLYQDRVVFRILPKNASKLEIDHRGSIPKTDMKEVDYSNTSTWNSKVGFTGEVEKGDPKIGISIEEGHAYSMSAGAKTTDFDMKKKSEGRSGTLGWVSQMSNMYKAGLTQPIAGGYNTDDPYSLVANGWFRKSLYDPPAAAESDLELEYFAAYRSLDANIKNEVVEFEFSTTQRLMHAAVVGRWGIPSLEVGGVAAVIPYFIYTKAEIKIDLPNRNVEVKRLACDGYDFVKVAGDKNLRKLVST